MIWTIAKKEFLEKDLDFRITASFTIGVILTVLCVFVAGEDYRTKKSAYDLAIANAEKDLQDVKVYSQYRPTIVFPPSVLSVFSKGTALPEPLVISITPERIPRYEAGSAITNPFMQMFDPLDVETVIRLLFSLLVILLTYDLIGGEKESATLRLIMSNPVLRNQLLLGKLGGAVMIVGFGVLLAFLIGAVFLQVFF